MVSGWRISKTWWFSTWYWMTFQNLSRLIWSTEKEYIGSQLVIILHWSIWLLGGLTIEYSSVRVPHSECHHRVNRWRIAREWVWSGVQGGETSDHKSFPILSARWGTKPLNLPAVTDAVFTDNDYRHVFSFHFFIKRVNLQSLLAMGTAWSCSTKLTEMHFKPIYHPELAIQKRLKKNISFVRYTEFNLKTFLTHTSSCFNSKTTRAADSLAPWALTLL